MLLVNKIEHVDFYMKQCTLLLTKNDMLKWDVNVEHKLERL